MAEVAGLALGAVGILGIFSTCVECFDIVDAGRNHSKDLEQLSALVSSMTGLFALMLTSSTQLALERLRFCIWGQTVGLAPRHDRSRAPYDTILDRPDIRPVVEETLFNIKSLLDDAGLVIERYKASGDTSKNAVVQAHAGLELFRAPFEQFKLRIRKQQKDASTWKVTRWAIHDAKAYNNTISRLQQFVDGLEKVTSSTHLAEQRAKLQEEIENISNVESLELLRDASSKYSGSLSGSSLSESRLLTKNVAESVLEVQTQRSNSILHGRASSAVATLSYTTETSSMDLPIPGAWPRTRSKKTSTITPCQACMMAKHISFLQSGDGPVFCISCKETQDHKNPFLGHEPPSPSAANPFLDPIIANASVSSTREAIPQNQRLMNEIIRNKEDPHRLCFSKGDKDYGDVLEAIKAQDHDYWLKNSGQFLTHAATHSLAAKRMFFELRNIKSAKVPFVSAAPLRDSLDTILASIEGPPETPYEGGVFWIIIRLSETDPFGPPLMKFHTKIYHPNISPRGDICADYSSKWRSVLSDGLPVTDVSAVWFSSKSTDIRWSLGALLIALCGLLASPDIDDPLVPEIARTYIEDYDRYCKAARKYTREYATSRRPNEDDLQYPADLPLLPLNEEPRLPTPPKVQKFDAASIQQSWRERYEYQEIDEVFWTSASDSSSIRSVVSNERQGSLRMPSKEVSRTSAADFSRITSVFSTTQRQASPRAPLPETYFENPRSPPAIPLPPIPQQASPSWAR
jgi:ubiquitin-protein ligase